MIPPLLPKTLADQLYQHILLLTRNTFPRKRISFEEMKKFSKWSQELKKLIDIFMGEQDRLINEYIKLNQDLINTKSSMIFLRKEK